jgi:hypothetical protein
MCVAQRAYKHVGACSLECWKCCRFFPDSIIFDFKQILAAYTFILFVGCDTQTCELLLKAEFSILHPVGNRKQKQKIAFYVKGLTHDC